MNIYYMSCIGGSHCNVSLHTVSHTIMGNTVYKQVNWLYWPVYIYIVYVYNYIYICEDYTYNYIYVYNFSLQKMLERNIKQGNTKRKMLFYIS